MPQQFDQKAPLRTPPRVRFQGAERCIDLRAEFAALPGESIVRDGHIQKTLYRWGPMTTAIFVYEQGAQLPTYEVQGEAVLHVLSGRVRVETESETYEAGAENLVLLDPNVKHCLTALEPTRLLLTVVLMESPEISGVTK
jgi:mannose-6-phosphate isomerase-like protein (cupin superfamily)